MNPVGVLLYGGPASGKDTVTSALLHADSRFQLFQRLKSGPGRTTGYRMTSIDEVDRLRRTNEVLWENERYSSIYVVDRPELDRMLTAGLVPVVHLGQEAAVETIRSATPSVQWIVAELWCPRPVATARIDARGTGDASDRLRAWDETGHLANPDLFLDTSLVSAADAAEKVRQKVAAWTSPSSSRH